jgi:acyl-CoA synthetase (AMP-forming)/AMP-acid ligase II
VSALDPSEVHRFPSIGRPLPGVEVEIFDDHHGRLPAGGVGELRVRGAGVTPGYLGCAGAAAQPFHDGWLRTGDLGYRDGEGYLYLTGRSKNIIVSGGVNISPEEVESVLSDHPGVRDVVIRAESDEQLGEVPVAHVVAGGDGLSLQDLHGFLSSRLSRPKWPRRLYLHDELPRTRQGKLSRASGGPQSP